MFLGIGALKIWSKFTEEHPCEVRCQFLVWVRPTTKTLVFLSNVRTKKPKHFIVERETYFQLKFLKHPKTIVKFQLDNSNLTSLLVLVQLCDDKWFKDTINSLELLVEKRHYFNQSNEWLNNIKSLSSEFTVVLNSIVSFFCTILR